MKSFKKYLGEKLKASDDMGDWVKDFQDSDAPQFKGKSKEKRRQMAIAAKLDAEREAGMRKEEVELDEVSTEKLRDYASAALQDKNKAKADKRWKYAGKAMQTVADREVKAAHDRKYNKMEEVELDEAEMSLYDKIKAARKNPAPEKPVRGRGSKNRNPKTYDVRNKLDKEDDYYQDLIKKRLQKKNEEVELEEAAPKMKGDWLKKERERNREHDAAMGRTPTGRKKPVRQMTSTQKSLAKMRGEEVELDEVLDTPKAMDSYRNKAKYSKERAANSAAAKMLRNPKGFHSTDTSDELNTMDKRAKGLKMADRAAARKTRAMLMKKEDFDLSDFTLDELEDFMMSEEFTQLDEVSKKTLASYIRKASDDRAHNALEIGKTGKINFKGLKRRQGINRATARLAKEEVELDEALMSGKEKEAFESGKKAARAGQAYKDNPHSDSKLKLAWSKGHNKAKARKLGVREEAKIDEVSASTLRSYVDKARADKSRQQKARTVAKNDYKKYGIPSDKERADAAHSKASQRNTGISMAKRKLGGFTKGTQPKVLAREEAELDEAKTNIYHKHMLKALGKSRLPKNHQYTSAIANNGDFVVKDGGGRTVGRIAKGDHNLKD